MAPDRKGPRAKDDLIDWFTVSYRTIYVIGGALLLLMVGGGYYYLKRAAPPPTPPPVNTGQSAFGALFNAIEGSVQVRQAGTLEWRNADRSTLLTKSDLVRTGSGGSAEIRFTDGTVFHVRPDSLITIDESSENPVSRKRQVAVTFQSGEANFQTPQKSVPGSATTISTPTVRTTAGDDVAGNIAVAESGDTGIKIFRGTVGTETKSGQRIALVSNEGLRVDATGTAGAKMTLPGVPTLLAPPHQAEIAYVDPARSTTLLAWKAVPGAAAYHFLLDFNVSFTRPVYDRKDWKGASMELTGLEVGTYYWKVAAIDKDGVQGSFSDFARFAVTKPQAGAVQAPPPPLTIETLEARGNILQVKGKTEPGASLTVNGQRIDVAVNGTFNEYITMEPGAKPLVVVRATGINGGVNEQKRPVVFSY
jgi:FecR protein